MYFGTTLFFAVNIRSAVFMGTRTEFFITFLFIFFYCVLVFCIYNIAIELKYSTIHFKIIYYRTKCSNMLSVNANIFNKIKSLGILKKRRGNKAGVKRKRKLSTVRSQRGVNYDNLIQIPINLGLFSCITIGCLNLQSIRNKNAMVSSTILDNKIDLCILTET